MRRVVFGMVLLWLTGILLAGISLPAWAAEQTGSIQVTLRSGDLPVVGGTVTLFRVGQREGDGFRIEEGFGGGMVRSADAMSPHLAQWLAQKQGEPGMTRVLDADGSADFSRLTEGLYLLIQNDTVADHFPIMPFLIMLPFEDQWEIEAYPCTQQVYVDFPALATVPVYEAPVVFESVPAYPDSPQTGQHPGPLLGAVGMVGSGIGLAICVGGKRRR